MEPAEFGDLVRAVRALERSLGDGHKRPQPSERELRIVARRSIVAARALEAGDVLTAESLAIKRPGGWTGSGAPSFAYRCDADAVAGG